LKDEEIDYSNKLHCVDEFAKRWWYALPEWPAADFNYAEALQRKGLHPVDTQNWSSEPDVNKQGLKKV
jgi:hypothetical protein